MLLLDENLALRRDACRRFVKARIELPGAESLLRDWFGAEAPEPKAASAPLPGAAKPGPKAGEKTSKGHACQIALEILANDDHRPPRGYGRRIAVARLVNAELRAQGIDYKDDSIRSMIGQTVREWEDAHPHK